MKACGTTLYMVRGDADSFVVELQTEISPGEYVPYIPEEGSALSFALKHDVMKRGADGYMDFKDNTPLVLKSIPIDTMQCKLEPADTEGLGFGQYAYDIRLTLPNGEPHTCVKDATFYLWREVH